MDATGDPISTTRTVRTAAFLRLRTEGGRRPRTLGGGSPEGGHPNNRACDGSAPVHPDEGPVAVNRGLHEKKPFNSHACVSLFAVPE